MFWNSATVHPIGERRLTVLIFFIDLRFSHSFIGPIKLFLLHFYSLGLQIYIQSTISLEFYGNDMQNDFRFSRNFKSNYCNPESGFDKNKIQAIRKSTQGIYQHDFKKYFEFQIFRSSHCWFHSALFLYSIWVSWYFDNNLNQYTHARMISVNEIPKTVKTGKKQWVQMINRW